jgi:hypothetical protein
VVGIVATVSVVPIMRIMMMMVNDDDNDLSSMDTSQDAYY